MARNSLIDDLFDTVKSACFYLPLWVILVLAFSAAGGTYWWTLHAFGDLMRWNELALPNIPLFAATLVFLIFIVAGIAGWTERKKRTALLAKTTSLEKLRALSWREFEKLVGEAYRKEGYSVCDGPGNAADGGIDLDTRSPTGERVLIQCKHWKSHKIGVPVVREMLGILTREKADRVVIIVTGGFTKEAVEWAKGQPIELVDGFTLIERLKSLDHAPAESNAVEEDASTRSAPDVESCPQCGGSLVIRTAKRGAHVGKQFMGCTAYPACRFTKSL